jgi:hypothetical protein
MMRFLKRRSGVDDTIKNKLLKRLRSTTNDELMRWTDNIHTGVGRNISEMRKSLTRNDPSEALAYIDDTRTGAVSLLAAMQVLEERLTRR